MPRLTKTDIEQGLLSGKPVTWKDANNKLASILLDAAKQRRLTCSPSAGRTCGFLLDRG